MAKHGKKYRNIASKVVNKPFALESAVKEVKKLSYSKFTGSVELHMSVNLPKDKEAKSVKGAVSLPHSVGKVVRVAVFTTPENEQAAKDAGAELVGLESLVKEVKDGKINFDVAIATPNVMPKIAVLGKELGPRGLMPSPKNGTVAEDVAKAVEEYKKGKLNYAMDETGVIHIGVGKVDSSDADLVENIDAVIKSVATLLNKPVKQLMKSVYLAPTMGPSVKVELASGEETEE